MSGTRVTGTGMISPAAAFVDPATGFLPPVSFRFLSGLFQAIQQLQLLQGSSGGGGGGSAGIGNTVIAATLDVSASQSTGTAPSTGMTMVGLGLTFVPLAANVAIDMQIQIAQTTAGARVLGGMLYGQGTPPAAGSIVPLGQGLIGGGFSYTAPTANTPVAVSQSGTISGLNAGQTYWADIAVGAGGDGQGYATTATLTVHIGLPPNQ